MEEGKDSFCVCGDLVYGEPRATERHYPAK